MGAGGIKDAIKSVLNVEFLARLVKIRKNFKTVSTPIENAQTLMSLVDATLAKSTGMDATMVKACKNDVVVSLYKSIVAYKLLVPSEWNTRQVSDWMYLFSREIWSLNALTRDFGPKRHPEESTEEYNRRRRLGAKNTLSKMADHISLVESLLELFTQLQSIGQLSDLFVVVGVVQKNFTSLVGADAYLIERVGTLSKGEVSRLEKIQQSLYELQLRLETIVAG